MFRVSKLPVFPSSSDMRLLRCTTSVGGVQTVVWSRPPSHTWDLAHEKVIPTIKKILYTFLVLVFGSTSYCVPAVDVGVHVLSIASYEDMLQGKIHTHSHKNTHTHTPYPEGRKIHTHTHTQKYTHTHTHTLSRGQISQSRSLMLGGKCSNSTTPSSTYIYQSKDTNGAE